jgi:puromycin-sensitive aminopeptidase
MTHATNDKNFRLPSSIRPSRYQATVEIDIAHKRFSGQETITLSLEKPTREIVLHANELNLARATLEAGDKSLTASAIEIEKISETVTLKFAEPVQGQASLAIDWTGAFCPGLRGLYLAGNVAVTQFEAADARRLFPCFDEPSFKARWAIRVRVPKHLAAIGNGPIEREEVQGDHKLVTFRETELLSSYLIALAVGDLTPTDAQSVNGVPVRTWSTPEKRALTAFGQEVAVNVLPRLEEYFGLPYAFGKVDQVGVPDFEAGAMENAGLITYREIALLLDPKTAPLSVQKRVAEVVTHELAHQWFGNWVTMVWWDDLWLNEAFATWMAYKIVAPWKPHWRIWLDFDAGKARALGLDALQSTHPVRGEVRNAEEAGESFDLITYEKGGATLRMIENYLGEEKFRAGIRAYMKKHARANAVADDLWRALAEASNEPVLELANAWIRQSGFPLIGCEVESGKVRLSQRRFYSQPGSKSEERWPVPVVLRFSRGGHVREQRVLFREGQVEVALEGSGNVDWLCANGGNSGFYRVAYGPRALEALGKNLSALEPAERISLLSDTWALVRSGERDISAFLELAVRFEKETDYAVLDELVGLLGTIESRLVADDRRARFQKIIVGLFGPQLAELGWEGKAGENDDAKLRRAAVVRAVGLVGRDPAAIAEASARVGKVLAGNGAALEPNLLDAAFAMAARAGDAKLLDALVAKIPAEKDPAVKRRFLVSLAMFESAALADRVQALGFSDTVPMQDFASYVAVLFGNRGLRATWLDTVQKKWDEVIARTGGAPMILRRVIEAFGGLVERAHYERARKFVEAHPVEAAKQATSQTLERLAQDVELRDRTMGGVGRWVEGRRA